MKNDTPIALADLEQMTVEERELLLEGIRDRRLKPVKIYEELSLMQNEARKEKLEQQWEKALEMFEKDLARVDKAILTLEARSRKLRTLELEIEQQ
jgi:hypothetical protein|tara:strand:+ start:2549 stop:2836 length:288 start_codon:yes stop_codon:yes gene_type:complete